MTQDRPSTAVLGFRPHTYWTASVALMGTPDAPRVFERRKIVFAAGQERSVFHHAAEAAPGAAPALIEKVRAATVSNARAHLDQVLAHLGRDGVTVRVAVVTAGSSKVSDRLEDILKTHSRIHAAEGNFYRDVVVAACEGAGLEVRRVVERDAPGLLAERLGLGVAALQVRMTEMGARLGPPWSVDQRLAAMAAWLHL